MNQATGNVSAVRGVVKISPSYNVPGVTMDGVVAMEVHNNTYSNADSFSVTFAANRLPASNNAKGSRHDSAYR